MTGLRRLAFLVLAGTVFITVSSGQAANRANTGHSSVHQVSVTSGEVTAAMSATRFWSLSREELAGTRWPVLSPAARAHVDYLFSAMSDEERVAQILMLAWGRDEPSGEILRWIRERNVGGVKVFGWNGEDLPSLTRSLDQMQRASVATTAGIPLFTATDQEGGWVRHIKGGTLITPGNMAIGATGLPYDAFMTGEYIGMELRALGVNMNFAPTVDVYVNPEAHVIGPRAFSSDPRDTALLGLAFFRGMEQSGVIATAKHFPGHGNATGDSHGVLPVIADDFDTLWQRDLLPFRTLIREGVPAILGGHLSFPEITGVGTPATLSPFFNIGVLRNQLGFQGLVITDDMYMGGATVYAQRQRWSFAELIKEAVIAGNDIIMLSRTPGFNGEIWNTLITAYREEERFRKRVDESVRRILDVKVAFLLPEWRVPLFPDWREISAFIRQPAAVEFLRDHSARSVTVLRDAYIPHRRAPGERVLLVGKNPVFLAEGRQFYRGAGELLLTGGDFYLPLQADRQRLLQRAPGYDTIIFLLSDPNTLALLRDLEDLNRNVIVYSILTPIYLRELPWVRSAIAVYGWGRESFQAGFSALRGDFEPEGTLPIRLDVP